MRGNEMIKRNAILLISAFILAGMLATPASAQTGLGETIAVGGGWWSMPNVGGGVSDSGLFAALSFRAMEYYLEIDYAIDDPNLLAISADYTYPLTSAGFQGGANAWIGAGYTYLTGDGLESEHGFNVMAGTELTDIIWGTARYDFLGSDQEMFTLSIQYIMK